MKVSGWKNGKFSSRKPVELGIRVGLNDVTQYFDQKWDVVLVELDGAEVPVTIPPGFWN